jgi:diguanylate cyclase (GGDEF)-like protein
MAEAERLLSGRTRHIRLGGKIESAYRERSWRQNRKIIRAWMIWVVLIDALTLMLNVLLLPRDVTMALLGPAAIIPLAATGVFLAWRKRRSDAVLEWSLNLGMFFILLAVCLMGVAAGGEWYERYLNTMVFVAIAGVTIFNIPLRQTVGLAVVALALYLTFQLQNPLITVPSALSVFLFFTSGVGATVMARRTMTILAQKSFLLELRDRRHLTELAEANARLEQLSRTDALTGVANRRWMTELLGRAWNGLQVEPASIAMLMCDIDDFKRLNDLRGHAEGDRCLIVVANLIAGLTGNINHVARYGGEEFLVLLPGATATTALEVAEQIREGVAAANLANPDSRAAPHVTMSIGVAVQPAGANGTPEQLHMQADVALYVAKRSGRNRVELYHPNMLEPLQNGGPTVA